ncbi:hypothetical protein V7S43_003873 [Phytophthora oleae]|uniref:Auto-transporter adhesin head GIN domain-containing protein n=1 Tax=Phytophthora oleae TaxID=2107226 RepID=A0ABD3FYD8_9STRA
MHGALTFIAVGFSSFFKTPPSGQQHPNTHLLSSRLTENGLRRASTVCAPTSIAGLSLGQYLSQSRLLDDISFDGERRLDTNNNGGDNDDDDDSDDSSDDGDDRIESIKLQLPGRVFVSYSSSLPSGILGYVNVSGNSQSVVETVKLKLHRYLLTEIFLSTSNIVDDVEIESTAEVVIEDGVLVSSNTNKEVQIKASDSSVVYVSSSALSLQDLKLELSDSATLQLTTDSITIREDGQFQAHDKSSITVLTSSLKVDDLDLDAENSGKICISATELTASSYDGQDASKISLPNASSKYTSTGSDSCDEASTPSREPGCVSSSSCASTTTSTSTPSTTTASSTSTTTTVSNSTATTSSSGIRTSEQTSGASASANMYAVGVSLATGLVLMISL